MPAYIVVETDIHDPEQYELYKQATPAAVEAGGGRFIARGGELAILEGDWRPIVGRQRGFSEAQRRAQ